MQKAKVLSYIGLATRARKSVSGEFSVENSVRKGKAKLVVVSEEEDPQSLRVLQSTAVCSVQQRRTGISMWEGIPNVCSSGRRRTGRCGDPGIRVNTGNGGIENHAKQAYQSL